MLQYASHLEETGWRVVQASFFGDEYLSRLYNNRQRFSETAISYFTRVRDLVRWHGCGVIWLEKEALPWLPWPLERAFLPTRLPIVTDYDDAVFHRYDLHNSAIVRHLLGRKIDRLMKNSAMVFAGNQYLADRARAAEAPEVKIVPTVLDVARYAVAEFKDDEMATIGWIGTPSTWSEYVKPMLPLLQRSAATNASRITAVGAGPAASGNELVEVLPWSEDREAAMISKMGVGIMPLTDTPWARGKCGYKLIQYMACGIPVIASPVGVNSEIVEHGVNGFLAATDVEWQSALQALLSNPGLRRRMGSAGRKRVENSYSLQTWAPRIGELLHRAVLQNRNR